jgi:hypothetical protein
MVEWRRAFANAQLEQVAGIRIRKLATGASKKATNPARQWALAEATGSVVEVSWSRQGLFKDTDVLLCSKRIHSSIFSLIS